VFTGLRPGEKLYFLPLVEYIFETFSLIYWSFCLPDQWNQ
jgi:hypothetical protein